MMVWHLSAAFSKLFSVERVLDENARCFRSKRCRAKTCRSEWAPVIGRTFLFSFSTAR